MNVLRVYLRLYADCMAKAVTGIGKNLWTLSLPVLLFFAWQFAGQLLRPLNVVGGFLLAFVQSALFSCYLYFVGEIVANTRVTAAEFRRSIWAYFWSVVNLMFVLWIVDLLLGGVARGSREGTFLFFAVPLAEFVLLNAAPEVIYQRGTYGGLATVQRSVSFIHENWIEWFVPNLLLGAAAWKALSTLTETGLGSMLVFAAIAAPVFHLAMVFRGHLFCALDGTSHRQRMFRFRTSG